MNKKLIFFFLTSMIIAAGCSKPSPEKTTEYNSTSEPILIGDLSSYSLGAAITAPAGWGFKAAVADINKKSGVLGRPLKLISRDDLGNPADAIRQADELFNREGVVLLIGCNAAHIELAISEYAKQNKKLFVSACTNSDEFMWAKGHRYAFRAGGPPVYVFNRMLAERAAKQGKRRWATVNHNYAWGQSNLAAFRENLGDFDAEVTWVAEHWPSVGKLDAGATVQSILNEKPDAIYTSLWGADLTAFVREGNKRGLFEGRLLVGDQLTRPETIEQLGLEIPEGVLGFSVPLMLDTGIDGVNQLAVQYHSSTGKNLRHTALMGYHTIQVIANAIEAAKSTNTETLVDTLEGFKTETLLGEVEIRKIDHHGTVGVWIGETGTEKGTRQFLDWDFKDGKDYFPPDDYILNLRNASIKQ
ncbi:MAG: ABC transporter substrate-binding protein [Gammaproteobacteria bacterium]|nr:ABC transporter substrate-binding protein [Gammaproteobacteria bacterium]